ncbi:major facilitator superfamily protein [Sarocladium implicatum]|nr:major facilitator superfamily protein [Sarocladium implicatum]
MAGPPPAATEAPRAEDTDGSMYDEPQDDQAKLPMSKARCIALVVTLTGAAFLNTLANQSVIVILPTIGRELSVPESRLQWIISSYSLAFGCFLLFWGRVADIYGKRLIFIGGSAWVTVVTAANPFLPNEIAFDLFRGLHGLGSAANVPTAIGIIGTTFPPGKAKNYAFSCYAAGAPLGGVFGNIVSGTIANATSWKWVFGVGAMLAGIITFASIFLISPPPPRDPSREIPTVDWIGAFLITAGLILLMFALTEGNVVGWQTPWVPVLIVVSLLIVACFTFWQRYLEHKTSRQPMLKMSLFRNLRFTTGLLIFMVFFAAYNNFMVFATYYYQQYQGLSPLQTALRFVPGALSGLCVAYVVSQLMHRVPALMLLGTGHLCMLVTVVLFSAPIPPSTSYFAWGLPAMILSTVGSDTLWPCIMLSTSRELPSEDQAMGGALVNAMSQFGRAIGLAVATAVQTAVVADALHVSVEDVVSSEPHDPVTLKGLRAAGWLNVGLMIASLGLVIFTFRNMDILGKAAPASRLEDVAVAEAGQTVEARVSAR